MNGPITWKIHSKICNTSTERLTLDYTQRNSCINIRGYGKAHKLSPSKMYTAEVDGTFIYIHEKKVYLNQPLSLVLPWCWTESVQFSKRNNKVLWILKLFRMNVIKNFVLEKCVCEYYVFVCLNFNWYVMWCGANNLLV